MCQQPRSCRSLASVPKYDISFARPRNDDLTYDGLSQAFWWPDIITLVIMFTVFTVSSFVYLHLYVKEKR